MGDCLCSGRICGQTEIHEESLAHALDYEENRVRCDTAVSDPTIITTKLTDGDCHLGLFLVKNGVPVHSFEGWIQFTRLTGRWNKMFDERSGFIIEFHFD